jgi:hypothetical protein
MMTQMMKAPDLGVVKSLAKALRKSLPETVTMSHSRALEVSANAFGFSTWHACRTHFDRLNTGAFDPPESPDVAKELAVALIREAMDPDDRVLKLLSGELRTFRSGPVEVTGGISCGRSLEMFLAPLIELGARHAENLSKSWLGEPVAQTDARRLRPHVNTMRPVPVDLPHIGCPDMLLIGCPNTTILYGIPDFRVPGVLKVGLLKAKSEKPNWIVDLDLIQKRLREDSAHPHPEATFGVSSELLLSVMRGCQERINEATTPEPD